MEIGIGIDPTARLSWAERRDVIREAAQLDYTSAWTPAGLGNPEQVDVQAPDLLLGRAERGEQIGRGRAAVEQGAHVGLASP